jgi:hypothetical protein
MRTGWLRRLLSGLLTVALALPLGCVNPFKPSDPAPPDGNGVAENFQTPDDVLETLRLAVENKSINGENAYINCFADSVAPADRAYRSFYDPAVRQVWQSGTPIPAPEPWNRELERGVPRRLNDIRQNAIYSWQWSRDPFAISDEEGADSAQFHRKYVLLATDPSSNNSGEIIAQGYCDLSFLKIGNRWAIVRWNDRLDPTIGANPSTDQYTMTWYRLKSLTR